MHFSPCIHYVKSMQRLEQNVFLWFVRLTVSGGFFIRFFFRNAWCSLNICKPLLWWHHCWLVRMLKSVLTSDHGPGWAAQMSIRIDCGAREDKLEDPNALRHRVKHFTIHCSSVSLQLNIHKCCVSTHSEKPQFCLDTMQGMMNKYANTTSVFGVFDSFWVLGKLKKDWTAESYQHYMLPRLCRSCRQKKERYTIVSVCLAIFFFRSILQWCRVLCTAQHSRSCYRRHV